MISLILFFILIQVIISTVVLSVYWLLHFKSIGTTKGVCIDVRTYMGQDRYDAQEKRIIRDLHRYYEPLIRYQWDGVEYIGKTTTFMDYCPIFIGDEIFIKVHKTNKKAVLYVGQTGVRYDTI